MQRRRKEVWDGGKTTGGLGDRSSPARFRGGAPVGALGDEVRQKLENFKSSYKQILRILGSISHIFTYICLFFRACRHHSTKSAKWGHLIPFVPLVCKWGGEGTAPSAPGSAAYAATPRRCITKETERGSAVVLAIRRPTS